MTTDVTNVNVRDGGLSQSFKHGEQYKERLTNFRGSVPEVVADVIAFFGLEPKEVEGLTPFEVIALADQVAQGVKTVAAGLGGTPIAEEQAVKGDPEKADPWTAAEQGQAAEPEKAADPLAELREQITSASTQTELKRIWAANRPTFDANPELMTLWKATGKELPA